MLLYFLLWKVEEFVLKYYELAKLFFIQHKRVKKVRIALYRYFLNFHLRCQANIKIGLDQNYQFRIARSLAGTTSE
jgi:hypothetical protein